MNRLFLVEHGTQRRQLLGMLYAVTLISLAVAGRPIPSISRSTGAPQHPRADGSEELPRRLQWLANEAVATEDDPHPIVQLGAITARLEPVRPRPSCHSRARSDGQARSLADNHGQRHRNDELAIACSSSMNASRECA
jgi:hypothetical protein